MDAVLLIGRVVLGVYFLYNAYNHFSGLNMMAPYAASQGVPLAKLAVLGTGVLLLLGGLSLLLGFLPWVGAILLIVFLVPVAFTMHRFWGLSDQMMAMNQRAHFLKNLAIAGALVIILYYTFEFGAGPLSLS